MKISPFILLVLMLACDGNTVQHENNSLASSHNDYVTLIIRNDSGNPFFVWKENSFLNVDSFEMSTTNITDTIEFPVANYEYIYISHKGVVGDTLLCARGDTINVIASQKELHFGHISHNDTLLRFQASYQRLTESQEWKSTKDQIESWHESVLPPIRDARPMETESDRQKQVSHAIIHPRQHKPDLNLLAKLLSLRKQQYIAEKAFADDFGQMGSDDLAGVFKERLKFEYNKRINNYRIFFTKNVPDSLFAEIAFTDRLLDIPYARKYIQSHLYQNVIVPAQQSASRNHLPDYKIAYDRIPGDWPDSLAKFARYISLEMMVDTDESFKQVQRYYDDFKKRYPYDKLAILLEKRYLFDLEKYRSISSDLQLMDNQRQVYSLDKVLNELRGHFIYIDLWASWCVPCRKAMPDSKQLAQKYDGKVKFVYISLDKDTDQWRVALNAERLNTYQHNYLVVNPDNAQLLKDLKVESIPRYLIYDKNSKLIHQNAPGPDSEAIIGLLNEYLAE